ncbi:MAG: prevent-host-death protein [Lachnospiraceae bacterium]|nr:prevent-host-death protein [Lachnospiraceae bacterium]
MVLSIYKIRRENRTVRGRAHKEQEPIFVTKNGYSDLVVMSSELYDKFARINRIDQAIFESEQEKANDAEAIDAETVFAELEKRNEGRLCQKKLSTVTNR